MGKDLIRRGFRFVGSTICNAFMQATGMVNDHARDCFRYKFIGRGRTFTRSLTIGTWGHSRCLEVAMRTWDHLASCVKEVILQIEESSVQVADIIPSDMRWLAIAAGCISGGTGSLLFGPLFLLFAFPQVLGAIIQPYRPRTGRVLLLTGAMLLTVYTLLFLAPQAFGVMFMSHPHYDLNHAILLLFLVFSLGSMIWCDVALGTYEAMMKRARQGIG